MRERVSGDAGVESVEGRCSCDWSPLYTGPVLPPVPGCRCGGSRAGESTVFLCYWDTVTYFSRSTMSNIGLTGQHTDTALTCQHAIYHVTGSIDMPTWNTMSHSSDMSTWYTMFQSIVH